MFKRILLVISFGAVLLTAVVLTLPWWLGTALRHFREGHGLEFSKYENVGYGRWALEEVSWRDAGIAVTVTRFEAPHPLDWWWRKSESSPVLVDDLKINLAASSASDATNGSRITGPWSAVQAYHRIRSMLPAIAISSLVVDFGDERTLEAKELALDGLSLSVAEASVNDRSVSLAVSLKDPVELGFGGDVLTFEVQGLTDEWQALGNMSNRRNQMALSAQWLGQKLSAHAQFLYDGWIPDFARIRAEEWAIPAAEVGLGEQYLNIGGAIDIVWREGRFDEVYVSMQSEPVVGGVYPPLSVSVTGEVGLDSARVESLEVSLPGLSLLAEQPFEISRESALEGAVSQLRLRSDLSRLPTDDLHGELAGSLRLTTRRGQWPLMEFTLAGNELGYRDFPRLSGDIDLTVAWPQWDLKTLQLEDQSGSEFRINSSGFGPDRRIETGQWSGSIRSDSLTQWLGGSGINWSVIETEGSFSGGLENIAHEGAFEIAEVKIDGIKPMSLTGDWHAQGTEAIANIIADFTGETRWSASGEVTALGASLETGIYREGRRLLVSKRPVTFSWQDRIRIADLDIEGPDWTLKSPTITMDAGSLNLSMNSPDWVWLGDVLEEVPSLPLIRKLVADLAWEDGSLSGAADFDGDVEVADGVVIRSSFSAISGAGILEISQGDFGWDQEPIATFDGALPISISTSAPYWEIHDDGVLDARIKLERSPELWRKLAKESRVRVENPAFDLSLAGTWKRPTGEGMLSIEKLTVVPVAGDVAWPVITGVEAKLVDRGAGLAVAPLTARFDGQPITVQGQVPFTPDEWAELSEAPLHYLREKGRGSILIPRADLSALAKFVPDMLVPTGQVELALDYAPGQGVNGQIVLEGAVTRPLGPLGALQDLRAELLFANRGLQVNEVQALMGGQPVRISGEAEWPASGSPLLDLTLVGKNLPLVRNTGVLLRSDLDLKIESDDSGNGRVSGEARLRDGLLLVDVRSLVPRGGGASVPNRRPPYFSVEVEPIDKWELDVGVVGERFLRLRTPVVSGIGSVDARLLGTLEIPRIIGEITLDEGQLRLPFARLDIDEAFARLTEVDPYDPEIRLEAGGQRLGYDLMFELSGKASDPRLELQSSPILSSEEVLLLVMAGVTPRQSGQAEASNRALKLGMYFSQGLLGSVFGTDENDRLTVSSGEQLSRQGKETYRFDYEVADRWTVVAEYDEFDHYNAAIKWRIRPGSNKADEPESEEAEPETQSEEVKP